MQNRFTISRAGSTASKGIGPPLAPGAKRSRPRSVHCAAPRDSCARRIASRPAGRRSARRLCRCMIDSGSHTWCSPLARQWNSPVLGNTGSRSPGISGKPRLWRSSVSTASVSKFTPCQPAGGPLEAQLDHFRVEPDGFEDLRTLVGLQGRDAHLGHHFQHSFGHRTLVGQDHFLVRWKRVRVQAAISAGLRRARRTRCRD